MKVLIIGCGAREHALAWQCALFDEVKHVFVAPGNAGTALEPKMTNIDVAVDDINGLINIAQKNKIDLTIVGPEVPLVIGVVDAFKEHNLAIFGPTKKAAQLEWSKIFCKDFLMRNNISTAFYKVFTKVKPAIDYIKKNGAPIVIKADGLTAGKGVIVATSISQAITAVYDMLKAHRFGRAGSKIIIEEFLTGEEVSFIVMVDGENILPLASSQDYKARDDGGTGPNTGGMGAYSPAPIITNEVFKNIINKIIKPTVVAMAKEGRPYNGFLYAGLIIDKDLSPKVLEYNCRLGDPEAQVIMLRLKSNLAKLCLLATKGQLANAAIKWDKRAALGVVLAAQGYPNAYKVGEHIKLPPDTAHTKVFHAGSRIVGNNIVSSGGRVLCATALGDDILDAKNKAYELLAKINWQTAYYRSDIGFKAIKK